MNKQRGEIALAGTDYVLRYDLNALCELEAESGENITAIVAKMEGSPPSLREVRLLLWGGLRSDNPKMTVSEAGHVMAEVGIAVAVAAIGEGLTACFGMSGASEKKA